MKRSIKILGCLALLAIAGKSHAQYALPGAFGAENNGEGWMVYCDGGGHCGIVGAQGPDGGYYFQAANGSEWTLYMATKPGTGDNQK